MSRTSDSQTSSLGIDAFRCGLSTDFRYLTYSIHFSKFMAFYSRGNGQNTKIPEVHFSMTRRRLPGAQSINTERATLTIEKNKKIKKF